MSASGPFASVYDARGESGKYWWSQPVDATLYLKGEMECALMSHRFHRGFTAAEKTEFMGSLEARRVAEGDRAGFRQAVIVDLFSGGAAWRDSSCRAASLQAGIDAGGARGDFQRHNGTSIGALYG